MPSNGDMHILLVEDSDDDQFFFQRLFAKAGLNAPLAIASDGQQAIDMLAQTLGNGQSREKKPVPSLIFLDLKLPLRSGFEVLQWVRSQPALARTVVVVLSSSAETRDVVRAYELGAQSYLVKYPEPAVFREIVNHVAQLGHEHDLMALRLPGLQKP
jgi:CheY-like chemotaxis protein